jgi:hypothetical protein
LPSAFVQLTLQPLTAAAAALPRSQTVAMLPTGAGKTLIAAWLIKHYADALLAGLAPGAPPQQRRRRWVVFLCPTKLLVRQQAAVLRAATPLTVGEFTGDAGVDLWDEATWAARLAGAEIVVATPQVVVDALAKSFLQVRAWAQLRAWLGAWLRGECGVLRPAACGLRPAACTRESRGVCDTMARVCAPCCAALCPRRCAT